MARKTKKCFGCKQEFRSEELITYTPLTSKSSHNYCKKCLDEKLEREKFSSKVCSIFGIKAPGPRIWTERKRLIETYGYTDNIIIECLDYIYNVENKKKMVESLCLISPPMVDKMRMYQQRKQNESLKLARAAEQEVKEYIVPIQEGKKRLKIEYDPDEWLD